MNRDQRIRDPVHDLVKFSKDNPDDKILWLLLQTEPMQRLRRIRQLGFSEFVYPGASHTRLSHAIGVMQMARRMLNVLERNKVFNESNSGHKKWRQATLCAALLHDVGHGPYSHVFEEISRRLGVNRDHEDYTRQIIRETEVADILSSARVLDKTLSFFEKEAGSTMYSSIVSSQLDADRLDFIMRDRYFTGIQSAAIDLEWLFDSLGIEKIFADVESSAKEYSFVLNPKGLSVVEEYLFAYSKMYANVYFHKTTRAVQFMVQDIFVNIFDKETHRKKLPNDLFVVKFFASAPEPKLNVYLELDDTSIIHFIKYVAQGGYGIATTLARRFLARDLYKCFSPPKRPKDEPPREKVYSFLSALKQKRLPHHMDLVPAKGYKQYEIMGEEFLKNILVYSEYDAGYRPIADLIPSISEMADRSPLRFYFRTESDRQFAQKLWNSL